MHARYPLRKTFYREAPGGDKARSSGATAQKVRRAKEVEGREGETGKVRHGKRVGHVSPTVEQPMPALQQAIADNPQRLQFPSQNQVIQAIGMQACGVGKGRTKSLVRVGPASG